jgi:hypothetical protein
MLFMRTVFVALPAPSSPGVRYSTSPVAAKADRHASNGTSGTT